MVVSKYDRDAAMPRIIDEVTVELARRHEREASVHCATYIGCAILFSSCWPGACTWHELMMSLVYISR